MATYQTAHIILFDEQGSVAQKLRKGDIVKTDQVTITLIRKILDSSQIAYSVSRVKDEFADVDDDIIIIE